MSASEQFLDKIPTYSVSDFPNLCRTCLSQENLKPILSVKFEEIQISDIIQKYTSIQVTDDDKMPPNICNNCIDNLIKTYIFNEKCAQADAFLKKIRDCSEQFYNEEEIQMVIDDSEKLKQELEGDKSNEAIESIEIVFQPSTKRLREARKRLSKSYLETDEHFTENKKVVKTRYSENDKKKRSCPVCGKKFTSSKLRQHMRCHTKEKPYECNICLQRFSVGGNLKRHVMTHTGERPHICEICGKGFIQTTTLNKHKTTHTKNEALLPNCSPFMCEICGRGFKRVGRYNAHLKKHDLQTTQGTYQEDLKEEVKEFVCDICKRTYKTKNLLKAHQLTHGEKTFLCTDCGKGFVTKAALQSHFKVHTGEKPYTCNICKKSFAHIGSFEAHTLIHMGKRPYSCKECHKSFTQLTHLKYHLRTHSGERPYVCSYCRKRFALKGNLTVHMRIHTGETPYLCPVCGKGFYDSSSMKKHQRGHGETINIQNESNNENFNTISLNEDPVSTCLL